MVGFCEICYIVYKTSRYVLGVKSKFFLMYPFRSFSCIDTANACDGRAYDNGRRANQKEGNLDGKGKGKNEQNEDTNEQDARKRSTEKSVFTVGARGNITTQKRGHEKRNDGKNGRYSIGVFHGKSRKAGNDEKQNSDDKGK